MPCVNYSYANTILHRDFIYWHYVIICSCISNAKLSFKVREENFMLCIHLISSFSEWYKIAKAPKNVHWAQNIPYSSYILCSPSSILSLFFYFFSLLLVSPHNTSILLPLLYFLHKTVNIGNFNFLPYI